MKFIYIPSFSGFDFFIVRLFAAPGIVAVVHFSINNNYKSAIMKKVSFLITFLSIAFISSAQFTKTELQASGLTCSMCSNAINKALKTLPFVASVSTDLNKNMFTITYKDGQPVDFDAVRKKVEGAGFSVANMWVYANMNNLAITNNEHVSLGGLNLHFMHVKDQTLQGEKKLRVIDKSFVSSKEFKTFSAYTSMPCYQNGVMADCCAKTGSAKASKRIYHVTI
jgi:copper chaperone CopZ